MTDAVAKWMNAYANMCKERDSLRAEVERLHANTALDQSRLIADLLFQRKETAAFLDRLAGRIDVLNMRTRIEAAADCRAKARELRGET